MVIQLTICSQELYPSPLNNLELYLSVLSSLGLPMLVLYSLGEYSKELGQHPHRHQFLHSWDQLRILLLVDMYVPTLCQENASMVSLAGLGEPAPVCTLKGAHST